MAVAGVIGGNSWSWMQLKCQERKQKRLEICCSSSSSLTDCYKTLRVQPGASQSEVKKAFRQLALQYHPDVCRWSKCGVQFHQINQAYDVSYLAELIAFVMHEFDIDNAYDGDAKSKYDLFGMIDLNKNAEIGIANCHNFRGPHRL
ncbi:Chaperone protein dnaJ 8 [Arachis hypogaea]|nr:Chaperone protein dnaJ 8 [Arachis hypogaea]